MIHTIQSDQLIVSINEFGAELDSIACKKSKKEYLWQADPKHWDKKAPVLFPIVARLKDEKYNYNGKEYHLPIHGFADQSLFTTSGPDTDGSSITFSLESSEETLKVYPFKFKFNVVYEVTNNCLKTTYNVENKTDGLMYFSCGSHEGFAIDKLEDYYLEFDKDAHYQSLKFSERGLYEDGLITVIDCGRRYPLTFDLFEKNDSIAFANVPSKKITLASDKNNTKIIVDYTNVPNVVIWTRKNAPYICIEPWDGLPDPEADYGDFSKKPGIITLQKNETYDFVHRITITEG